MPGAAKLCGKPGCGQLEPCPVHQKEPWEGSERSAELPPDWRRRRKYVLERDPICCICEDALSTEVDHIVPGSDHSYENLQGVCAPCHKAKTQREAADARARRSDN